MTTYKDYESAAKAFIDGFSKRIQSFESSSTNLSFIQDLQIHTYKLPNTIYNTIKMSSDQYFCVYGFGTINQKDYGYAIICESLKPKLLLNLISSKLLDLNYYKSIDVVEIISKKDEPDYHNIYLKCKDCC